MAKFTRYDPRNKKNGKHKELHQIKDLKIRDVEDLSEEHYIQRILRKANLLESDTND